MRFVDIVMIVITVLSMVTGIVLFVGMNISPLIKFKTETGEVLKTTYTRAVVYGLLMLAFYVSGIVIGISEKNAMYSMFMVMYALQLKILPIFRQLTISENHIMANSRIYKISEIINIQYDHYSIFKTAEIFLIDGKSAKVNISKKEKKFIENICEKANIELK